MVLDYIPLATALIGTSVASIWDLKTTEVPDQLPYIMIAIGLLLYGYQSLVDWNIYPLGYSLMYGFLFLAFGGFMYYSGQWGGADSLILAALGFLLPVAPPGFSTTLLPFPLAYFTNVFIIGSVYIMSYALFYALKDMKIISSFVNDLKASANILSLGLSVLFVLFFLGGLLITNFLYGSFNMARAFQISMYPLFSVSFVYLIWRFMKSVEIHGFRKNVHVSKLKVGDMLLGERKLIGITEDQIKSLKKKNKFVDIKMGVPFAPAFPLALLVTLFYGDIILILVNLI